MEKRVIIAIALSILIIVGFQYFVVKPAPPTAMPAQKEMAAPAAAESPLYAPPANLPEEKTQEIQTDKYIMTFSNIGGAIKDIRLKDYKALGSVEPFGLTTILNPKEYIFSLSDAVNNEELALSEYDVRAGEDAVTCTRTTKNFEIKKKYLFRKSNNSIDLEIFVRNISGSQKEFAYSVVTGAGLTEKSMQDKGSIEVVTKIGENIIKFKRPKKGERILNIGPVGWEALKNKYFSLIVRPFAQTRGGFYAEDSGGNLVAGIDAEKATIQPGATLEHKYSLYAGPSSIPALKAFGYGAEESVNYGMFGAISKFLIAVLKMLYFLFHNWGIAIILLSVFLNLITFPLTAKSFKSMQKMQELHPQMEKLKVLHKNDPQKLNKEIMGLYKKYNINPLSGCLPILLQMPIFIALYQALMKSIELRNASFLWIRDLSSPEAIPLPVSFPIIGNSINILPLIMVGAMVMQQKMSTKSMGAAVSDEQKQQQKMMLIIMPIMFGFIFYNMPSGLVLYWVVNTVLTIVEQAAVLKKE